MSNASKVSLAAGAAAAALGSWLYIKSPGTKPFLAPAYEAVRVIDGDTFVTQEGQYVRVASTEAPEPDRCGGKEAKEELEKLVLDKPIYLKVVYRDPYQRSVSFVYADGVFVNRAMLEGGRAYYSRSSPGKIGEELKAATEKAREEHKGIFGTSCTQTVNPKQPKCNIKGNARTAKIYYLPGCGVYDNVEVQLYLGDVWFCSEKEAIKAGFRKPDQCP